MLSRMKKRSVLPRDGIKTFGAYKFMVVATLTGISEIAQNCFAAFEGWQYVFHRKRLRRKRRLTPAIFANAVSAFFDFPF